jgi:hypothetical protein
MLRAQHPNRGSPYFHGVSPFDSFINQRVENGEKLDRPALDIDGFFFGFITESGLDNRRSA